MVRATRGIHGSEPRAPGGGQAVKRLMDLVGAGVGMAMLAPVAGGVALAIRLSMGSSVLFRQLRPGLAGEPFELMKFRSMRVAPGQSDAARLTPLGRLLRSTSLDELPTLWNVWRGEMSLVGPRPLLMAYLDRYTETQARRHDVKPGITGWAQVNGRNAIDWQRKLALDVWYVDHWSLLLDLQILARTVWQVVRRDGISAEGHATMPEFTGSAPGAVPP